MAASAQAQVPATRPDAGTLQERPRVIPTLPAPGGPAIRSPAPAPRSAPSSVQLAPAGFRFTGNSVFGDEVLQRVVAARIGRSTDLAGLEDAAREVREYYQDHGFLLTDAFVPEQAFARAGGVVTIQVVEARVGRVTVTAEDGVPASHVFAIARRALPEGSHATEYLLDLPVLMIRDLAGHDATASVQPGSRAGEVDVVVSVRAQPRQFEYSIGADNHGVRAAGRARVTLGADAINVGGRGDSLSARVQVAENTGTRLYRFAYTLPVHAAGTRATFSAARSEYALGGAFEALGASGAADTLAFALLHPFVRGRAQSVYGLGSLEHKALDDRTLAAPAARRRIVLARVGIAGNAATQGAEQGSLTSYAASVAFGRLQLDAASEAADAAPGGPGTQGGFAKLNGELQHTRFFTPRLSLGGSLQAQWAANNLASAEKMSLGGPAGVRAYPSGEAVGDSGVLGSLELRWQALTGEPFPLGVGVFLDAGRVRLVQQPVAAGTNARSLGGAGFSLLAGTAGRFLASAAVAWRTGPERPSGGEADRSPRLWLTTQAWF